MFDANELNRYQVECVLALHLCGGFRGARKMLHTTWYELNNNIKHIAEDTGLNPNYPSDLDTLYEAIIKRKGELSIEQLFGRERKAQEGTAKRA